MDADRVARRESEKRTVSDTDDRFVSVARIVIERVASLFVKVRVVDHEDDNDCGNETLSLRASDAERNVLVNSSLG